MKSIALWILAGFLLGGCEKDREFKPTDLFTSVPSAATVPADGASRLTLSVSLLGDTDQVDIREVHFKASSGSWVSQTGQLTPGEVVLTADAQGVATAQWQVGRIPGTVTFTTWVGDEEYRTQHEVQATPALPDTVLVNTPSFIYDTASHVATINTVLLTQPGNHSIGLPLIYRAWKMVSGEEVIVGNFLAPNYQITAETATYSVTLDLKVPSIVLGDTIKVAVNCGGATSRVLDLYYQ